MAVTTLKSLPCVRCGTTGGLVFPQCIHPARINGAKVGVAGKLCQACYSRLYQRLKQLERLHQLSLRPPEPVVWPDDIAEPELTVYPDDSDRDEIQARVAIVRRAKVAKLLAGDPYESLSDAELDEVLPPVECYRTRVRMERGVSWDARPDRGTDMFARAQLGYAGDRTGPHGGVAS